MKNGLWHPNQTSGVKLVIKVIFSEKYNIENGIQELLPLLQLLNKKISLLYNLSYDIILDIFDSIKFKINFLYHKSYCIMFPINRHVFMCIPRLLLNFHDSLVILFVWFIWQAKQKKVYFDCKLSKKIPPFSKFPFCIYLREIISELEIMHAKRS